MKNPDNLAQKEKSAVEQEQLLRELEKRSRQLAALHETALEITTRREMPELLQAITLRAANLLDAPGSSIQLIDSTQKALVAVAVYGYHQELRGQKIRRGEGVAGTVWQTGRTVIVDNYDTWPKRVPGISPNLLGSVLAAPIKLAGEVIGVLTCHTEAGTHGAFDQEDAQLLENLGRQAAIAIENARLFAIERKRSAELETLRQASLRLTSSLEYQPVLDAIAGHALQLVDAEDVHIFLYDGRTLRFGAVAWAREPSQTPYITPRPNGLTYNVARSGRRIVVPDVNAHPLYANHPWEWNGSIIGLPLRSGEQIYGVMNVAFNQPRAFDENDLRILELLADQAAIAIANARLYAQAQQDAHTKAILLREVSHRVKNNLTGIIGLLYAVRDHTQVNSQAEFQTVINELINRVRGLAVLHQILSASGWQPVRLDDLTRQIIQNIGRTLPDDKQLSVNIAPFDIWVTPDEAHNLALIINELTTNTIKHVLARRAVAHIYCQAQATEGTICYVFRDDGPGFAPDVLNGKKYNMGFDLIRTVVRDNLGGVLSLYNCDGATVQITFPAALPGETDR